MRRKKQPKRGYPPLPKFSQLKRQAERDLARNRALIESQPSGQGTPREGGRYG